MRVADLVTAVVLMALGGLALGDWLRLGIGWGTDGPQSGFFPFWLAVIMNAACVVIFVQVLRRPATKPFVSGRQISAVLAVLWPATAAVALMHVVGLYVAAALYMGFYMRWGGHNRWRAVIPLAIGVPVVAFLVFEMWFLVPMPKGPRAAWLGYVAVGLENLFF